VPPAQRGDDHRPLGPKRRSVHLRHRQERNLADRGGHLRIGRRGREGVAAAHRGPERRDPRRVDAIEAAGMGDCCGPVLELASGHEQVRLTVTVAEAAVVEHKRGDPRFSEPFGERAEEITPSAAQAMRHDDRRRLPGPAGIQPRRTVVPMRLEPDLLAFHDYQTSSGAKT
jgi:hypothetical protein